MHRFMTARASRCVAGVLALAVTLPACANYNLRRQMMKDLAEDEIILRGEANAYREGDRVVFIHDACKPSVAEGLPPVCREIRMGRGTVMQVVGRHHFLIKADPDAELKAITRVMREPAEP